MALRVRLSSTTDNSVTSPNFAATVIELVNSSNTPTPGGDPTNVATTPYALNARSWTMTSTPRQTIYSGGPPFAIGRWPLLAGFDNVTETIEIGIAATNANNMMELLQRLRRTLNAALIGPPAVIEWQPDGVLQRVGFQIYSADVQEVGDWQNPAAGFPNVLCRVTWTRSAFGGVLPERPGLMPAAVSGSSGYLTIAWTQNQSGDLRYVGQPTNTEIATTATATDIRLFLGTIAGSSVSNTIASFVYGPTTSTTGIDVRVLPSALQILNAGPARRNRRFVRTLLHLTFSASQGNAEVQVDFRSEASSAVLWRSAWINPNPSPGTMTSAIVDMGSWDLSRILQANFQSAVFTFAVRLRSTDGGSVTVTQQREDYGVFYTWCQADFPRIDTNTQMLIQSIYDNPVLRPYPLLPLAQPFVGTQSLSGNITDIGVLRGQQPLQIEGANLYAVWGRSNATAPSTSIINTPGGIGTLSFFNFYAPLYHTLRGLT